MKTVVKTQRIYLISHHNISVIFHVLTPCDLYPITKPQPCWAPHLSLKSQLSNARPKPHPSVDIGLGCRFPLPFPSVKRLGDLRFRLGIPYNPPSLKNQCILVATRAGRGSKPSNQWVNRGLANLQIPEVSMPFWESCLGRLIPRQPCETCLSLPMVSIRDI